MVYGLWTMDYTKKPQHHCRGFFYVSKESYSSIFTFPLFFAITSSAILFGAGE